MLTRRRRREASRKTLNAQTEVYVESSAILLCFRMSGLTFSIPRVHGLDSNLRSIGFSIPWKPIGFAKLSANTERLGYPSGPVKHGIGQARRCVGSANQLWEAGQPSDALRGHLRGLRSGLPNDATTTARGGVDGGVE